MAAPRRMLASTLLRTAATAARSSIRASNGPSITASTFSAAARTPWRPVTASPRVAGLRWYSAKDDLQLPENRVFTFSDVQAQLEINKQLEKSGQSETADGQKKVTIVGQYS